jgi:Zn finger protein HypA/HybF involved in hydrogenase expression
MEQCKKCGNEFEPKKGLVSYCSLTCRNSRSWTESDKLKKSKSAKNSEKVKEANSNRTDDVWIKIGNTRKENHRKQILESKYEDLSFESLRFRILYEQENKCNKCGLDEWLGESLVLELEHKDGNHFNNDRNNLEMLCPNCHSLTETWRGRNKRERKMRVSDEKLLEALLTNDWNMRQALILVGLAAKGGNYNRCHRLKREYDLVA